MSLTVHSWLSWAYWLILAVVLNVLTGVTYICSQGVLTIISHNCLQCTDYTNIAGDYPQLPWQVLKISLITVHSSLGVYWLISMITAHSSPGVYWLISLITGHNCPRIGIKRGDATDGDTPSPPSLFKIPQITREARQGNLNSANRNSLSTYQHVNLNSL